MLQVLLQEHLELFVITLSSIITALNIAAYSRSGPESKLNALIGWVVGTVGWYLTSVLFGVKILEPMLQTLLFSLLMSSMTCVPAFAYVGLHGNHLKRIFIMFSVTDTKEKWILGTAIGATFGAWIGVLPVPLDWERWWQAWPITCLVGSLLGYIASLAVLSLLSASQRSDADKVRKD